jgi:hypothetical protein
MDNAEAWERLPRKGTATDQADGPESSGEKSEEQNDGDG